MTGPHLSGLEFRGHIETVGNTTSFIEITTVFEAIGCVDHATKRNTNVIVDTFKGPFTNYVDKILASFDHLPPNFTPALCIYWLKD